METMPPDESTSPQPPDEYLSLLALTREASAALAGRYHPVFRRYLQKNGLEEWAIGLLLAALALEPETVTAQRLEKRVPYIATSAYLGRLEALASKGYLVPANPGVYRLAELGRTAVQALIREARARIAETDPLPASQSRRLIDLLDRLVEASRETPPPPYPWSIQLSCRLMPQPDPPLPYIEQALSCLEGYRDDAHRAAWEQRGYEAPELEALTLLWRGEAQTTAGITNRLGRRGHPLHVYQKGVERLRRRGLVAEQDGELRLTPDGQVERQEIESETNRFFFAPWEALTGEERSDLAILLADLRDGLRGT